MNKVIVELKDGRRVTFDGEFGVEIVDCLIALGIRPPQVDATIHVIPAGVHDLRRRLLETTLVIEEAPPVDNT